ncbi:ATP-binding cassette domain-containing protein [Nocardia sp. NBC_00511]|uniref:ATP-binding cassette domain-containing protein n=1 Tax=Nocardia sp. NBC_00511 TaxID=2903591 RepID=UPI0030DE19D1
MPDAVHGRGSDRTTALLGALAAPGQAALRRSAIARVFGLLGTVSMWGAVVTALTSDDSAQWLPVLAGGALLRLCGYHYADRAARLGGAAIAAHVAESVTPVANPATAAADPAGTAWRMLDLGRRIGEFQRHHVPARLAAAPSAAAVLLVVAVTHWPAAVLLLLATPIIPANLWVLGLSTRAAAAAELEASRLLSARLHDRFRGLHTLTALHAIASERERIRSAAAGLQRSAMMVLRRAILAGTVLDAVVTIAVAVIATYCGLTLLGYLALTATPVLSFGAALFVLVLAPVYFAPWRDLATGYHLRDSALAATAELACAIAGSATSADTPISRSTHPPALSAHDVAVRALRGLDIEVRPGTILALTGPSGSGKTTILSLFAGLMTPDRGHVTIDDRPPLPGSCSWLGHQTAILAGSLADNVRLGSPEASTPQVRDALERAGLSALLNSLPHGIDTAVGADGAGLSTGEAQRLSLARALLRDAPLWLVDEPTAHLDAATEAALLPTLAAAWSGRTVVVATHSPAVAALADLTLDLADRLAAISPPTARPLPAEASR